MPGFGLEGEGLEEVSTAVSSAVFNRVIQPRGTPIFNSMNQLSLVKGFSISGPVFVEAFCGP